MATAIVAYTLLFLILFHQTEGDCKACPEPASVSCPDTASISALSWKAYSNRCPRSSSHVTITSLEVAQADGDGDSFTVTVVDEDGYNNMQNGRPYKYYGDIGIGKSSVTCYQYSGSFNVPTGVKSYVVITCTNYLETCNLRVKIDATCHDTDPCSSVHCGSNGYCTNGVCLCNQHYSGIQCETYNDPCDGVYCGYSGHCTDGVCICDQGYSGTQCQIDTDPCDGVYCSGNGVCDELDGGCTCDDGYEGSDCSIESNRIKIIIACSVGGGFLLLFLLIACCIAAAVRSRRRRSQVIAMTAMVPPTDPAVALVPAMEQQ